MVSKKKNRVKEKKKVSKPKLSKKKVKKVSKPKLSKKKVKKVSKPKLSKKKLQKKLRKTVKKVKSKKGVQNFDKDIDIQVENFFSQSSSFSNNEEEDPSENLFEEDLDFNDMDINEEVNDKKFHNHSLKDDLDKNLEGEEEFESFQEDHYIADEGDEDSEEMAFDDPFDDINDIEGEEEEDEGWS